MTACTSWFGHHKFEGRYDWGHPGNVGDLEGSAIACIEMVKAHKPKTYVRDVCTRCGATIERDRS